MASIQSQEILSDPAEVEKGKGSSEDKNQSVNLLFRLIHWHYGEVKCYKSPEQVSRESNLLPGVPFNRWFCMPAAILIQICCGSLHSWSVFNKAIDTFFYGTGQNMGPTTFYIAVVCFIISAALMGPWLERRGPMIACLLGASLFLCGNLLTALGLHLKQIWLVILGYGVVSSYGLGLCFISPVSALQKWFPDKRGLVSGLVAAICGFGVLSGIQIPIIVSVGLPLAFVVQGSCNFVILVMCALVLRTPPPGYTVHAAVTLSIPAENDNSQITSQPSIRLIDALTSKDFRLMYTMFLANSIFGLMIISRLSNMITDIFSKGSDEASTIVAINGGFNLGGMLFIPILSDYVGRKNCYLFMLTSQLIIAALFTWITISKTYWAFLLAMWILTACYGAGFVVIPAFLSDTFGSTNIGACYGVILTAWSTALVVGGLVFTAVLNNLMQHGYASNDAFPYNVNVWWIFFIVLIGWITLLFITPTAKDRAFTRRPRSFCRRILNRVTNNEQTFEMS